MTSPQVGDVVAGMEQHGGMTTVLELPASRVYPVPAGLDHSSAVAVVLTGVTAYQVRDADDRSVCTRGAAPVVRLTVPLTRRPLRLPQMLHRAADGRLATPSTAAILVHG